MGVGSSGRMVVEVEVEPKLKRERHSSPVKDGQTLKDWFVKRVEEYLNEGQQLQFDHKLSPTKQAQGGAAS